MRAGELRVVAVELDGASDSRIAQSFARGSRSVGAS